MKVPSIYVFATNKTNCHTLLNLRSNSILNMLDIYLLASCHFTKGFVDLAKLSTASKKYDKEGQ